MSPLNAINNGDVQAQAEEGQQQQQQQQGAPNEACICPICRKQLSERSSVTRHMKIHDDSTKIFRCMVCHKNDQRQKSNWRLHVFTHIGQEIPPELFDALDHETKAILTGTDARMKRKDFEERLAKAQAKKARKNKKAQKSKRELSFEELWYPICELRE